MDRKQFLNIVLGAYILPILPKPPKSPRNEAVDKLVSILQSQEIKGKLDIIWGPELQYKRKFIGRRKFKYIMRQLDKIRTY